MSKFIKFCKEFAANEEGLTVVEYVVGAALLVAGLTTIFSTLGTQLDSKLSTTVNNIS